MVKERQMNKIADATVIDFQDECPVHNKPIRKEYEFGRYQDATVTTFTGCRCAVCTTRDYIGPGVARYYSSYEAASGKATMAKKMHTAMYGRL